MTNRKKTIIFTLITTLIAISVLFIIFLQKPFHSSTSASKGIIAEAPAGGNFTLTSINGKKSLIDFKGKLVLLYFGYTYCPDICPTDLGNLAMAYRGLNEKEKSHVQILFVTVDPERDTATRMGEYTRYFDANIIGLTGTNEDIATVARQYGVVYMKAPNKIEHNLTKEAKQQNNQHYTVDHSAFTYIIDPTGQLQTQIAHATSPKHIQQLIRDSLNSNNKLDNSL